MEKKQDEKNKSTFYKLNSTLLKGYRPNDEAIISGRSMVSSSSSGK